MNISIDEIRYQNLQVELIRHFAKSISGILEEKGVNEELQYDLTSDLLFSVCTAIDASSVMGTENEPVLPFLTFSNNGEDQQQLIASESGSSLHEMVDGCVDELFDE